MTESNVDGDGRDSLGIGKAAEFYAEFLDRRERGEQPDFEAFVAEHTDLEPGQNSHDPFLVVSRDWSRYRY